MRVEAAPDLLWSKVSERIAGAMGLNFPRERWSDLQRGLAEAAVDFGFSDAAACGEWLLSARPTDAQLRALASHLTVGETYFFRERKSFDFVGEKIVPELLRRRRGGERRLRVWSAGCCTGEEAYSLAILVSQIVPPDWRVTILATDINERFLRKAGEGIYSEWSFREAVPGFKDRFFRRRPDGRYSILPDLQRRVTFAYLNLAEDVFPSLATDTNAMDLVFCRNVLMYFTLPQAERVISHLRRSLVDGGWLVVSPTEASQALFSAFQTVNSPGVILYQRCDHSRPETAIPSAPWVLPMESSSAPAMPILAPDPRPLERPVTSPPEPPARRALAAQFYAEGRYAEVAEALLPPAGEPGSAADFSLLSRALANQGRLDEALAWCDRWLSTDKLDPRGYYLHALISQELGQPDGTRRSLQRALYLDPKFVLAHFAMGNLSSGRDDPANATKHFTNALDLLDGLPAEEILPEADGLTVGRLRQIITSFLHVETTP